MRLLFVCCTEFQILNALNIKYHMFPECQADIVLQRPSYKKFAERIREIGLFDNVCYAKEEPIGIHQFFRDMTNTGSSDTNIIKAISNTIKETVKKTIGMCCGPKYKLNELLYGYEAIRSIRYDKVFMQNGTDVVRCFYQDLHDTAEMIILDEGVGSYYRDSICNGNEMADGAFLYDPDLALYAKKGMLKFTKIPMLSEASKEFVNIANRVFDYTPHKVTLENKIIFFDQGGQLMPAYLKNINWLKKIIFANAIAKHKRRAELYHRQIELFTKMADKKKVYIKYHPRTPKSMLNEYDNNIFEAIEPRLIPWELYACNNDIYNCMFVSFFSSAVCLYPLTIGHGNTGVLLYQYSKYRDDEEVYSFIELMKKKYSGDIVVVNDKAQLNDILKVMR